MLRRSPRGGGKPALERAVWARPSKSQTPAETCEREGGHKMVFEKMPVEDHTRARSESTLET